MANAFSMLIKPSGAICNLDCVYCYYLVKEALYPGSQFRLSEAVLEQFIQQYIDSQPGPEVVFAWQGGEPLLMGLDFYERALALQQRCCPSHKRIANTIQTNGVLIDEAWADFFRRHHWLVGVSLDGPPELHDAYRVNKGGNPTHKQVMKGLRILQRFGVEVNVLTAVHAVNAPHPLEVYRFLRDEAGARFIQFIPIVVPTPEGVSPHSVDPGEYGAFLTAVFDEWVSRDVGQIFVQLFDIALGVHLGFPSELCIFRETCGKSLIMEHNGDVYACDHFVDAAHHLGNITQDKLIALVDSPKQHQFGQDKRAALPAMCQQCPVLFICNGGCPKNRIQRTPDGESGLNYLCSGYQAFFAYIDRPMRWMANEVRNGRSPARVMTLKP